MQPIPVRLWPLLITICVSLSACGGGGGGGSSTPSQAGSSSNSGQTTSSSNQTSQPVQTTNTAPTNISLDLLVLFSPGVRTHYADPDLRIQHLVNVANDVFTQSGLNTTLNLVGVEEIAYPDAVTATLALEELTFGRHVSTTQVANLRDTLQADLVVLLRPYANDGYCGYAWLNGYQTQGDLNPNQHADFAYAVVASNCSDYVLVHEIGHNLGLAHSREEDANGGTFTHSVGFGQDGAFATIMADPNHFNAVQVPKFSSPNLVCMGQPCGVDKDLSHGADAVHTLELTPTQVADYR